MNFRKFFLTVGFSGLSPKAPGTVGSFVSLIIGLFLLEFLHPSTLFLLSLLITVIAIKQIDIYEKEVGMHDGKEIVIDELAGMWITLAICGINSSNVLFIAFGKESFTVTLKFTTSLVEPWSVILNPNSKVMLSSLIGSVASPATG